MLYTNNTIWKAKNHHFLVKLLEDIKNDPRLSTESKRLMENRLRAPIILDVVEQNDYLLSFIIELFKENVISDDELQKLNTIITNTKPKISNFLEHRIEEIHPINYLLQTGKNISKDKSLVLETKEFVLYVLSSIVRCIVENQREKIDNLIKNHYVTNDISFWESERMKKHLFKWKEKTTKFLIQYKDLIPSNALPTGFPVRHRRIVDKILWQWRFI